MGQVVGAPGFEPGPPAPKAGGSLKTTLPFSALLLRNDNLAEVVACGWLCTTVPICLQSGHKSWHTRDGALAPDPHTGTSLLFSTCPPLNVVVFDPHRPYQISFGFNEIKISGGNKGALSHL